MFRIFYAEKDTTLYESAPAGNTGLDEIIEIGKRLGTDGNELLKSRGLLKFDMAELLNNEMRLVMIMRGSCSTTWPSATPSARESPLR